VAQERIGSGVSLHGNEHGPPGLDNVESETLEGGRRPACAGDGEKNEMSL
jgi:hypothetical protein